MGFLDIPDHIESRDTESRDTARVAGMQPDITYHPDRDKWHARTARRLGKNPSLPNTPLPDGFPHKLESPLVWEGKDWQDEQQWVYELSTEELREIDNAVHHFHGMCASSL